LFAAPQIAKPVTVPARPVAGKRLTVSFPVTWTSLGKTLALAGARIASTVSIAGTATRHAGSLSGTTARVSFTVPKSAKGRHLKLTVTISGGSLRGEDSLDVDPATGLLSMAQTWYSGLSTTKVVNLTVH
jgi:hypothetical protein